MKIFLPISYTTAANTKPLVLSMLEVLFHSWNSPLIIVLRQKSYLCYLLCYFSLKRPCDVIFPSWGLTQRSGAPSARLELERLCSKYQTLSLLYGYSYCTCWCISGSAEKPRVDSCNSRPVSLNKTVRGEDLTIVIAGLSPHRYEWSGFSQKSAHALYYTVSAHQFSWLQIYLKDCR